MRTSIRYLKRILFLYTLGVGTIYAISLEHKYPSYTYVFNEFDVDESYLYNEDFISFVSKNEKNLKSFYQHSLRRGKEILPTMQGLLVDDGVSDLFIYLSMVESGFSTDAVSPKKAVGLWQFMPATAKEYDLTVYNNYDERCDTVSATSAAINYLNNLHKQFGKWYLAAMAYNCGEGCVSRAIKLASTDELSVLTDERSKYVPRETRQYIKKLLLLAMIGENFTLGFSNDNSDTFKNSLIQVDVLAGTSLKEIAALLKMKEEKLLNLNRSLKNGVVPKDKPIYKITIPIEKMYAFYLRYKQPIPQKRYKSHMVSHNVSLGETLESIAKYYNADAEEIRISNHLADEFLMVDDMLVIPVTQTVFEKVAK
ncbi:transglycosylase SLT domain-containing protein [Sulfurovum sp.]|uniref:lytic transglycosylase domain-containing protein n=1 Tax=Sulfurovum sp. TaxID=1969726 RepID=UPI003566B1CF